MNQMNVKSELESIQQRAETHPMECIGELDVLLEKESECTAAWMLKACIHFQRKEHEKAIEAFVKVVEKKPKSENASLGLFHNSYWDSGNTECAFEEMKRYFEAVGFNCQTFAAQNYRAIVREIDID